MDVITFDKMAEYFYSIMVKDILVAWLRARACLVRNSKALELLSSQQME